MARQHLTLQASEAVVVQAAAQIYAAYQASGRVPEGEESRWMERSIREAILMARAVDDAVISDDEVDADERQGLGGLAVGREEGRRSRHDR